jgi:hypothetical protein
MDSLYIVPQFQIGAFNCPHCHAYAHQRWSDVLAAGQTISGLKLAFCQRCEDFSIWVEMKMVYPDTSQAPPPNPDMPEDIEQDYLEAASIISKSPRGAAALIRLAMEKLCRRLNPEGPKKLNDNIQQLLDKGIIKKRIQQALDSVRIIGNETVHPGQLDLKDDIDAAASLFRLVNIIVQETISDDKEIEALFNKCPADKLKGIESREKKEKK